MKRPGIHTLQGNRFLYLSATTIASSSVLIALLQSWGWL